MKERIRAILFPILVISIVGSLWVVGWSQELEEDAMHGTHTWPTRHADASDDALAATPIEP